MTTGAEEDGGAARDGEDDGAPAVGERSGGADKVDDDAAKPMEVTPSREEVRSDDGGEPELGGDGGEKVRRCGHDSDGEKNDFYFGMNLSGRDTFALGLGLTSEASSSSEYHTSAMCASAT
uniref:Retrotransposon protein, putative, unclassified n=1 Tax=Oryza sativa subsp. japonica TaxID=39947 RepID=Q2QRH4_ORYSJ|nr:retrotransposon protein, putative, unclassified [Oryza sativa Japonica Group]